MEHYLVLKYVHILSAIVLVGTGFGIAFFQWMSWRSKNIQAIAVVTRIVVLADWLFTFPAILIQLITGFALMDLLHFSHSSPWFRCVMSLFIFLGACWIPVVIIQYRLRKLATSALTSNHLPQVFYRLMRGWTILGCCAFSAILFVLWLMVVKPLSVI